jgi:ATP-dependent DNA helicase RecG
VLLRYFREMLVNGVLNNAATILFTNWELMEYPQCLLRLAHFKGTDKMVFMDNQRVQGNLFKLLDAAMAFIFKYLSLSGTTEGLEREEHLTIPYKAIREGDINLLCHRQLRTLGGSVGIVIYDDRAEIENPGTFPRDWDMEKMKSEHCSVPQNPLIANVLYRRKVLESWGRGISLMTKECQKANLPEPEFELSNGFVKLVFRYGEDNRISTVQVPHKYHTSSDSIKCY